MIRGVVVRANDGEAHTRSSRPRAAGLDDCAGHSLYLCAASFAASSIYNYILLHVLVVVLFICKYVYVYIYIYTLTCRYLCRLEGSYLFRSQDCARHSRAQLAPCKVCAN
jgi:hypothetical protein